MAFIFSFIENNQQKLTKSLVTREEKEDSFSWEDTLPYMARSHLAHSHKELNFDIFSSVVKIILLFQQLG